MKTLTASIFRVLPLVATVVLASCAVPYNGKVDVAPGGSYGYGMNNGNSRPYRSDGKVVAYGGSYGRDTNYPSVPSSQYDRSPYGGGSLTRSYPNNSYPYGTGHRYGPGGYDRGYRNGYTGNYYRGW